MSRPRKDGTGAYVPGDAARKVADKLRLLAEGRLPPRDPPAVEADYAAPEFTAAEAREQLDEALQEACAEIAAWHADTTTGACPQIGIRATVGLGKSMWARRHLLALRARLLAKGAPARILVFKPSHALAASSNRMRELKPVSLGPVSLGPVSSGSSNGSSAIASARRPLATVTPRSSRIARSWLISRVRLSSPSRDASGPSVHTRGSKKSPHRLAGISSHPPISSRYDPWRNGEADLVGRLSDDLDHPPIDWRPRH